MLRWLGSAAVLLALAAGCVAVLPPGDGALQPILRPHDTLYRPDGTGPFPAVVLLHGCLGVRSKDTRWAESLRDQGYAALVVDSLTGRGLATLEQRRGVCSGWTLWGGTRAADVRASLAYLRTRPDVDARRLAVVGFSHGAWAALDFLAAASADEVRGLRGVVSFYPYCGVASRARWRGWSVDVPLLMLLGEADRVVSSERCRALAEAQAASGRPVALTVYPDVGHSFDWRSSPATEDARRRVRAFLAEHVGAGAARRAEGSR